MLANCVEQHGVKRNYAYRYLQSCRDTKAEEHGAVRGRLDGLGDAALLDTPVRADDTLAALALARGDGDTVVVRETLDTALRVAGLLDVLSRGLAQLKLPLKVTNKLLGRLDLGVHVDGGVRGRSDRRRGLEGEAAGRALGAGSLTGALRRGLSSVGSRHRGNSARAAAGAGGLSLLLALQILGGSLRALRHAVLDGRVRLGAGKGSNEVLQAVGGGEVDGSAAVDPLASELDKVAATRVAVGARGVESGVDLMLATFCSW